MLALDDVPDIPRDVRRICWISREKETQGSAMLGQLERFWRSVETEKNSTSRCDKTGTT